MAFINNSQIKKVFGKLFVDLLSFFSSGYRLVERQVNLIRFVGLAILDFGHCRAERFEVIGSSLINQNISVREEENPLLCPRLPKSPDYLKRGESLAGARRHY